MVGQNGERCADSARRPIIARIARLQHFGCPNLRNPCEASPGSAQAARSQPLHDTLTMHQFPRFSDNADTVL